MNKKGIAVAGNMIVDLLYPVMGFAKPGELSNICGDVSRSTGGVVCNNIMDLASLDPEVPLVALGRVGMTPPAKLDKLPESAIPTATPTDARRAAKLVNSMPNLPITVKNNMTNKVMFTILLKKLWILASTLRFWSILANNLLAQLMRYLPMKKMIRAAKILPPKSILPSINLLITSLIC